MLYDRPMSNTTDLTAGQKLDLLHERVATWTQALRADYLARGKYDHGNEFELDNGAGRKYCRVVMHRAGVDRSVHAFIDAEGNVYKAEGWKKPAKHVRFNLFDDESFETMIANLDWAGSYLYIK
jgi:hypothetical protein